MKNKKNLVMINHDKNNLNKSFDAIEKDEALFGENVSIEPISLINKEESGLSLTDGINNNLDFFFNDFDNIFNEKITKLFINKIDAITKEKIDEKLQSTLLYAGKIKDNEFKITFDENLDEAGKIKIEENIKLLKEEQKEKTIEIEKQYKMKIEALKDEFKNMSIQNSEWVRNLKEKYASDIDTSIYNFIGN